MCFMNSKIYFVHSFKKKKTVRKKSIKKQNKTKIKLYIS